MLDRLITFARRLRTQASANPTHRASLDIDELPALLGASEPIILDVGCNNGQHTLRFLRAFPRATVYSFEPDDRALEAFRKNVQSERAKLFPYALGNLDGVADFHMSGGEPPAHLGYRTRDWDRSGSIRKPKNVLLTTPWVKFERVVPVQIRRLDTWAKEHGIRNVDFIWADVQGAEADLIAGGTATLANTRFFYTEYGDGEDYEGQMNLAGLLRMVPDFEVVERFRFDILLRNRKISTAASG